MTLIDSFTIVQNLIDFILFPLLGVGLNFILIIRAIIRFP